MKYKKYLSLFIIALVILISFHFNFLNLKEGIYIKYPNLRTEVRKQFFSKKSISENLFNDYNVKFLPETQFLKINFNKKKITFNDKFYSIHPRDSNFTTFYIDINNNEIWIVDYLGNIYLEEIDQLKKKNRINLKNIDSNLSVRKVLDILIYKNKLYVSFYELEEDLNCLNIKVAEIDHNYLNFKKIFKRCGKLGIAGGKMQHYKHEGQDGLLITSAASHKTDKPNDLSQDDNTIYGKIIFINFENNNSIIFSKGHRTQLGLYADEKVILSTENGPRGGDEINKIIFNANYGWPISSYGEKYSAKSNNPTYLKNHISKGFQEPIFAFVPAIGISEIIKLPNEFSNQFVDNFIVSSLWDSSLYRIKFDANFNRIIFMEKIFVGQRIRDLKYSDKINAIIFALEEKGEIGIIFN
jgi:hypothetical protein